ncbi:hypothetical protein H072_11477 [Dactylellina haptotyla CBS 200.50]|uniref:Uncharacterized protein n=1 Tax=Dactylellina haptotyla (strain CBS 200.50) TaxID=1284197 RepID=S7ZWR7_DACHA|nr:hypothetical protein H072_11477 [Dactylellina haptotyla CBS 200.50]
MAEKRLEQGDRPFNPAPASISEPFFKRIKLTSVILLGLSFLVLIASIGFLSFLWYSNIENRTWQRIMVNEWATRAISLTSTAIRWAIATQAAVGLAMLASVALEEFEVPLGSVAEVSLIRINGSSVISTLQNVVWPMLRLRASRVARTVFLMLMLLATSTLIQFSSTVLLSDLRLDEIPGVQTHANLSIDWKFNDDLNYAYTPVSSNTVWGGKMPAFWPAFGEFSGSPFQHDGVVDTGRIVRAFLPYIKTEARQSLRNYTGKAVLLDSRVTCQKPIMDDLVMYTLDPDGEWDPIYQPVLSGTIFPSVLDTPRFNASTEPSRFDCPFSILNPGSFAICELRNGVVAFPQNQKQSYSGTLVSEFRQYPPASSEQDASGAGYLVISVNNTKIPLSNGEWAVFDVITPGYKGGKYTMTQNVTASICFSSLDIATRKVNLFSSSNRTEPSVSWNETSSNFDWSKVYQQLLPGFKNPLSLEERGLLQIEAPDPADSWVYEESLQSGYDGPISNQWIGGIYKRTFPYVTDAVHLWYPHGRDRYGNYSAILDPNWYGWSNEYQEWPEAGASSWIIDLFEALIYSQNDGQNSTLAEALQMILFSLAGSAYYDQLPQYDKWTEADTVAFVPALHPGGPHGTTRTDIPVGFTIVMVVIGLHFVTFLITIWLFGVRTAFSRLGDTWMAIASVSDALTSDMLDGGKMVHSAVEGDSEKTGKTVVGLVAIDGQIHLKTE